MRVASGITGAVLRAGGAPENLIYTNPQYASATVNANLNRSNYHSLQAQATLRPTRGLSFQTTYTWSRNLALGSFQDPFNRDEDYYLSGQHRTHQLSSYGTFNLPLGANGFLLRNATGALKKAVEGWQLSWIASITSGLPGSFTGVQTLWSGSNPNFVGPKGSFDTKSGHVTWTPGAYAGYFWGDKYTKVVDPICNTPTIVATGTLQSVCAGASGLKAIALASDPTVIVIQNSLPGQRGNFQPNNITGPGRWNLDMAIGKSIEFMEGKRIDFRIDAQNVFNHPTPSNGTYAWNARFTQLYNPEFGLNNGNQLGYISSKGGHRTFQAKIRIAF
jgi:hypothetical protein